MLNDAVPQRWLLRRTGLLLALAGLASGCAHFESKPLSAQKTSAAFEQRSLANPGLASFLTANHEPVPGRDGRWNLKALTLVAFYYQPVLAEARANLLAAQAAQRSAGERPNPSLSVTPAYDHGVAGASSPWIVPITLDWPVETAGKRGERIAVARHLAAAERWDLVGTVWEVRARVRAALLDLYEARQSEGLRARQVATLKRLVTLLQGQFRAGNVSSYRVTRAEVALDHAVIAEQSAAGKVGQAQARLAGALGVPLGALRQVRFSFAGFERFPRDLTRPQVRRQAQLNRADIRAALETYAARQSALALEIDRQWPDIDLGPGYTWNAQMVGDSQWQLGLTLPLPVLSRNQGPIAEARARRKAAAAHFIAVQAAAIAQIDVALAAYDSALARVATASALRGHLARELESTRARVEAGEQQPLDLADAQVALEDGEQSRLEAQVHAQRALGQLEDAVQSTLTLAASSVSAAQNEHRKDRP